MRLSGGIAAVAACVVGLSGCGGSDDPAPTTSAGSTSPGGSTSGSASARSTAATPPAPATSGLSDEAAATVYLRTNRATIVALVAAAGAMRTDVRAGTTGAASCTQLKDVALALTTAAPGIGDDYGYVPALAALTDATTKYFAASSACAGGLPVARFRDDFRAGDLLLKKARAGARSLGVQL